MVSPFPREAREGDHGAQAVEADSPVEEVHPAAVAHQEAGKSRIIFPGGLPEPAVFKTVTLLFCLENTVCDPC